MEWDIQLRAAVVLVLQVRQFTLTATDDAIARQLADVAFHGCRARGIREGDYLAQYLTYRTSLYFVVP